jgi:hypothetical protein
MLAVVVHSNTGATNIKKTKKNLILAKLICLDGAYSF